MGHESSKEFKPNIYISAIAALYIHTPSRNLDYTSA